MTKLSKSQAANRPKFFPVLIGHSVASRRDLTEACHAEITDDSGGTNRLATFGLGVAFILAVLAMAVSPAGANPTSASISAAANHYLAIVSMYNAVNTSVGQVLETDGTWTSDALLSQQVVPYIKAIKSFDSELLSYHWPKIARSDIRSLRTEDAVSLAILRSVTPRTRISFAHFDGQLNRVSNNPAVRVRRDLGLPPPSASVPTTGDSFTVLNQAKQYEVVTLVKVIDPAQSTNSFLSPNSGARFVGVEIQITNRSAGIDTADADSNTSVIGSNRQGYAADFNPISGCTNFNNGQYALPQDQTEIGCITFQLPTGVTISKIEYNPNSGFSANEAIWTIPKQ